MKIERLMCEVEFFWEVCFKEGTRLKFNVLAQVHAPRLSDW